MLVLSRKKNEAIVIGGAIEIEVVNVAKATVRVRLSAPKSLQVVRGFVKKQLGAEAEPTTNANPAGTETLNLTLVSQQVIELGKSVSLGVVDVDRSRALFFVDAPSGTNVQATDQLAVRGKNPTARQNLLQFMSPQCEGYGAALEEPFDGDAPRDPRDGGDPGPQVLPFPSQAVGGASLADKSSRNARVAARNVKPGPP